MYGLKELKQHIQITDDTVECPVKKCNHLVRRQRKSFKRDLEFYCPDHGIYISPSTFEYENVKDNLLWKDANDLKLLENIFKVKRESRMARNNSEDALSWNVFRYLEKTNQLDWYLSIISGETIENSKIMYWSFSQDEKSNYSLLEKASGEFGEKPNHGSEPDIIILCKNNLFFIEAKFTATNKTKPSNLLNSKKYINGGNNWYKHVFHTSYNEIAIDKQKYELMRFWLLGSWMAKELEFDFHLVNLVLEDRERDIETDFLPLINQNNHDHFSRQSWEGIYQLLKENPSFDEEKRKLFSYFANMTISFPKNGDLQKAFNL